MRASKVAKRKLITAYKRIFRSLMKLGLALTTFNMLCYNVDPFTVIERKLNFGFRKRLLASDNTIISVMLMSSDFYDTPIYKMRSSTLTLFSYLDLFACHWGKV